MFSKGILQFDLKLGHPYRSHTTGPLGKKHFDNEEHLEWLHNQTSFTCSGINCSPAPVTSPPCQAAGIQDLIF